MKFDVKRALAALSLMVAISAQAGVVKVWGESLSEFNLSTIDNFYNSLSGHSSSISTGTLDTVNLSNVDLLWATQPSDAYTLNELNAMAAFLGGGGRIAFLGEHGTFGANQNERINAALTYLGASIQIVNSLVDSGFRTASVTDGQILPNFLTTGVNTYEYAAFAPLLVSGSAQTLMVGEENPSHVMMAYQNIGAGSIFLITDQNVWDHAFTNWPGNFDNARMFENLLTAQTRAEVAEPGTLALIGLALVSAGIARRRT